MADESLLELERALRASPDDAGTRLRLVTLLARSGRRREALEHAARLPENRELSNELWAEELSRLERAVAVPGSFEVSDSVLDPPGTFLAWSSAREGLKIAELRSGSVVHSGPYAERLVAVPGKVFAQGPSGAIACFEGESGRVTRREAGGELLSVSPPGDEVLLQGAQREGVYRWPSLEPVLEQPSRLNPPLVDWETRLLLKNGIRGLEVHPLAGVPVPPIAGRSSVQPRLLGKGLVARFQPGLVVHSLVAGWSASLYELKGDAHGTGDPSLSGRWVRIILAGTPLRFELDLDRGEVKSRPDRVERLALARPRDDRAGMGLWHPHGDFVAQSRRLGPFEIRSLAGEPVKRLPRGAAAHQWTADGRALLVLRDAGEGRAWLELWRV